MVLMGYMLAFASVLDHNILFFMTFSDGVILTPGIFFLFQLLLLQ